MPPSSPARGPQVVIVAGGLGTRMLPRTERIPKLLLPVAGRPFAAWQLDRLAASGYAEVVLCIGHLGAVVKDALGDRFAGLALRYSDEGERRLGTAGALRLALPLLAPTFLVTYGDSYLPFDYSSPLRDLEAHPEAQGTMAVYRNEGRYEPSNAAISGEHVVRYEKGASAPGPCLDHIDYGATALRRHVVAPLPEGVPMGLDALQAELAASGQLRAVVAAERFYEVGSEAGIEALEARLASAGASP